MLLRRQLRRPGSGGIGDGRRVVSGGGAGRDEISGNRA
jgi:hypothetical protein